MSENKALRWLIPLLSLLLLIMTLSGLFWPSEGEGYTFRSLHGDEVIINGQGLYAYDSLFIAAGSRGTDLITLVFGLPFLWITYRGYRRGSIRAALGLSGVLAYLVYVTFSVTFAAAYNVLFMVYVAAFSAAFYALLSVCLSVDSAGFQNHIQQSVPHKRIAVFLFVAGGVVLLLWSSEIIPLLSAGETPALLDTYTTMVTHAVDMALIGPAALLAGIKILQGKRNYYRLGIPLIILNFFIGLCVISQTIFQLQAGVAFSTGQLIGMIGSWVILGGFAGWMILSMRKHMIE